MKSLSHVRLVVTPWTEPIRLLGPWEFPGKSTGVGCHFLLQGIFPTQGASQPQKILLWFMSKSVLSLFSSRNFITSGLTLRSLIWVYLCIWCQINPFLYLHYVALGLVSLLHDFDQHRDVLLYKNCKKDFSEKDRKKKKAVFYFESPRTEKIVIYL